MIYFEKFLSTALYLYILIYQVCLSKIYRMILNLLKYEYLENVHVY